MTVTKEWLATQVRVDANKVIGRALMAIYKRQTQAEQQATTTKNQNGIGFSKPDARVGSIGARMFMSHGRLDAWIIQRWTRPTKDGMPSICKYAKQLDEIAEERRIKKLVELNREGLTRIANDLATLPV